MDDIELLRILQTEVGGIIAEYMPETLLPTLGLTQVDIEQIYMQSYNKSLEDIMAVFEKKPDLFEKVEQGVDPYLSIKAVMAYRVANALYYYKNYNYEKIRLIILHQADKITEMSTKETGIYIHPAAKVNKKLIIECGTSTVIGEKVEIGESCYIHHGVIIGSKQINPRDGGHPKIGNNVSIGGCARILGHVTIGNNVCISPYCVVTENIPSNYNVLIVNQLQLLSNKQKKDSNKTIVYGVVPESDGIVTIYGSNVKDSKIEISVLKKVKNNYKMETFEKIKVIQFDGDKETNFIKFKLLLNESLMQNFISLDERKNLYIVIKNKSSICIIKSLGFEQVLDSLLC